MSALRELQGAVYRSLVARDDGAAAAYVRSEGLAPAARLSIYRNTFYGTLSNALRLSYPAVHRLVGAEFFEAAAQKFIENNPPRSAYLDGYGGGFADFLVRFPAAASVVYLPDVARLEWAVNRALRAPDATPLEVAALLELAQGDHDRVRFVPHPSVSLVRANYPADTIWRTVLAQDDPALRAIDLTDAPVWLLVQRLATGIDVQRLGEPAWRFTEALCEGRPLHAAVEVAPDIDVSALLAEHLAAGRFIAFTLVEHGAAQQRSETAQ
ncbi:MAG TPA: DNA-binding domain-containing protein [Casimicrobiaceae bacterium]|jgi:hypothetical protein|nr:DNA-binding domain-containing protein [Casimicrobiaceae bacterium]